MRSSLCVTAIVCAAIALAGLSTGNAYGDKEKGKEKARAASTKQLMKGLVAAQCGNLKKAVDAETSDWDAISLHAALLNEAGFVLLDDNRCPDGEWAKASKALQTHGAAVMAAAEKKDLAAAKAAFASLTSESCAVCHKAHKK